MNERKFCSQPPNPNRMKYFLITILCFYLFTPLVKAQKVDKTHIPEWVNSIEVNETTSTKEEGAFSYLLIDLQDNLLKKEQYVHYAVKILNGDGVQELSDISASYDPDFQNLEFHTVNIIRDGLVIEKLTNTTINTYQRETNLERSLYDGFLTSVINLSDVREGDIIEYAYTIRGFNPVNKGNYSSVFYQQYTLPVDRIYTRLLSNEDNEITIKTFNGATEPKKTKKGNLIEYIWDTPGLNNFIYDINTPYWYDNQSRVYVSTFANWEEVSELLYPLYKTEGANLDVPVEIDSSTDTEEDIIIKLIHFVQDEIRYLGFESGIGAYKPNKPLSVLDRRYGDCKDKSLLLSSLLQNQGITAYPILVNTRATRNMKELLPSHYLFNHCIVYLKHGGRTYFIDPTISNQGGSLARIATPDYKFGLILKENSKELTSIPKPNEPSLRIVEDILIDSLGGSATFTIKSEYTGNKADFMRSYFKNNTTESINKEYLNFYSSLYPGISSANKVSYIDDSRPWENIFTTNESYLVENIWSDSETDQGIYLETYAIVLDGLINYTKSAKREMPYYTSSPFNFEQVTRIMLPEPWNVNIPDIVIEDESFKYKKKIERIGNIISITHNYKLQDESIEGHTVSDFLTKHDKIRQQLGFQLTYDNLKNSESNLSWLSVFITVVSFMIGIILIMFLYKRYDPQPEGSKKLSIGGWLVLPAIGLVLTPFVLISQIFSEDYFNKGIWEGFSLAGYNNAGALNAYLGFELFYNILLFNFSILLILLFFKKRSSLPKLMTIFYGINLTMILFGSFVLNQSGIDDPTFGAEIFKAILSAGIWIPYFLVSKRVKETFVVMHNSKSEQADLLVNNLEK